MASDRERTVAAIQNAFASACAREGLQAETLGEGEWLGFRFAPQQSASSDLIGEHFARELLAQQVALHEVRGPWLLPSGELPRVLRGIDLAVRRIGLLLREHNSYLGDGLAWPFPGGPELVRRRGLAVFRYPSDRDVQVHAAGGGMVVELARGELGALTSAGFYAPTPLRGDFRAAVDYELVRWDATASTASLALVAIDQAALCRYHAQRNSENGHQAVLANLQGEIDGNHAVASASGWLCLERTGCRVSALHRADGADQAVLLGVFDRDPGHDMVLGAKVWAMERTRGAQVVFRRFVVEGTPRA